MDFVRNCRLSSFPDGVHVESRWIHGVHVESIWNLWGSVKYSGAHIPSPEWVPWRYPKMGD